MTVAHYPPWRQEYVLRALLWDIYENNVECWSAAAERAV